MQLYIYNILVILKAVHLLTFKSIYYYMYMFYFLVILIILG